MNLINSFDEYEKTNNKLLKMDKILKEVYYSHSDAQKANKLRQALLRYRREHSIFEVGDKVVHPKFGNMNIYEICEINGDLFTVFYDRKSHSFKSDVRHATDLEIAVGRRL